jgi:cysteine sulfinate desulfinase/cysteine desulfurase-like protein
MKAQNAAFEQTGYTVHDMLPPVAARVLVDVGLAAPKLKGIRMPNVMIVLISTMQQCLPNTMLLSVVRLTPPAVCNSTMKKQLESEDIIVSVGSACNTADPKASHVLYALGADQYIRSGCLRVSLGDNTTKQDVDRFIMCFTRIVRGIIDM